MLAFGAIYVIWGSVFLAMRLAVASFPPLLLIGLRCLGAGILLYIWVALKNHREKLQWRHWRQATIAGFCLFVLSQSYVAWAVQFVPSGIAAVMMALLPLWVVLLEWWRPGGERPGKVVLLGIGIGFAGMVMLVAPGIVESGASAGTLAALFLPVAALAWAIGTLYNRYQATDLSPTTMSTLQLLTSGAILLGVSTLSGDWSKVVSQPIKGEAILSLLYLIVFATVLTFSAYVWLLRVVSPAKVATYAYVNPVVALLLGSLFAGEVLTVGNPSRV